MKNQEYIYELTKDKTGLASLEKKEKIVRCKNCVFGYMKEFNGYSDYFCTKLGIQMSELGYCSYAEDSM